ncbi:hypothetical protein JOD57_002967 [Geodermatophilus bullaregiensis]|uniref:hypothetical protein n=1 Tax=Geodermatophilus bullaregiensis TaxID=1564160 RepID=UPI00195A0B33|nr:hypothetical protein [Geodermatophilus bullaregiensis]MBM7807130.1 hypothetical protein [Geodermatophilus bullaregiensis]
MAHAAAQLEVLRADRKALADRLERHSSWGWDVTLGLLVFGFLGSYATHDWWITGAAFVLFLVGLRVVVVVWQRRVRMRIDARERGPQRPLQVWLALCIAWALVASLELVWDVRGVVLAASAVMGLAVMGVSRWWGRAFVAQLRSEL